MAVFDADHPAPAVDQGPARVAGIEGRVGLDDALDQPAGGRAQGAAQGADDAGGDRGLEAQRIADRHHQLAHLEDGRGAESRVRQAGGVQPQHRQVGGRVVADQLGVEGAPVGEAGGQALGAGDHVAVGQDVAVGSEDHPRARPEPVLADGLDVDHRRARGLIGVDDPRRIGIEQVFRALGNVESHAVQVGARDRRRKRPERAAGRCHDPDIG
jgi:hypothetical protein